MKRRKFLAAAALAATELKAQQRRSKLLLPSDQPIAGFRIMWANPVPAIDQAAYRLKIGGLVDHPQSLSVDDLRKIPKIEQSSRMKCVQCWSARTTWGGFRFSEIIEMAAPSKVAKVVRIDCADKWYEFLTMEDIAAPRVMLALDMAGGPLPDRHGAPLRVIDPARYGYMSAKLVTSITFLEDGKGNMACDTGPYYAPGGIIQAGYDHPLDIGPDERVKIKGGEITEY